MNEKSFYLTFDGSPNPPATDRLLKILDQYSVPATFFMEGRRLEKEAECARRVLSAGHDIGNHSYNHPDFDQISLTECIREVELTQAIIHQELGFFPGLLRPPMGIITPDVEKTFLGMGFDIILWSYSVRDWEGPDVTSVVQRILRPAMPGTIVALHDRTDSLEEILSIVIPSLRENGYMFKKISQSGQHGTMRSL